MVTYEDEMNILFSTDGWQKWNVLHGELIVVISTAGKHRFDSKLQNIDLFDVCKSLYLHMHPVCSMLLNMGQTMKSNMCMHNYVAVPERRLN